MRGCPAPFCREGGLGNTNETQWRIQGMRMDFRAVDSEGSERSKVRKYDCDRKFQNVLSTKREWSKNNISTMSLIKITRYQYDPQDSWSQWGQESNTHKKMCSIIFQAEIFAIMLDSQAMSSLVIDRR